MVEYFALKAQAPNALENLQQMAQLETSRLQNSAIGQEMQSAKDLRALEQAAMGGDKLAMQQLAMRNPQAIAGMGAMQEMEAAARNAAYQKAAKAVYLAPVHMRKEVMKQKVGELQAQGYEVAPEFMGDYTPELDPLIKQLAGIESPTAMSSVGKIQADLRAGLITPEQAAMAIQGETSSKGTSVNVNIPNFMESRLGEKGNEQFQKTDVERIQKLREQADSASKMISQANSIKQLSQDVGYTGFGGETVQLARKIPLIGGLVGGDAAAGEALIGESAKAKSAFIEATKGAISDKENAEYSKATPSLSTTPEGIQLMTDMSIAGAERITARADFEEAWLNRHGNLTGARRAWQSFIDENPILVRSGKDLVLVPENINKWTQYVDEGVRKDVTSPATPNNSPVGLTRKPLAGQPQGNQQIQFLRIRDE